MIKARQCVDCGEDLPLEAPPGRCAACRVRASNASAPATIAVTLPESIAGDPAMPGRASGPPESTADALEPRRSEERRRLADLEGREHDFLTDDRRAGGDGYVLDRVHSDGGLGRIWLARDGRLGREVALKELLPHQVRNPEARTRFLKEAQITGQLEHPNIVPIYELGRHAGDGRPFYTMRFLRGKTLRVAIAEYHERRRDGDPGAREFRRLLSAFVSVCHAVAYAHFRGVVHRDLKPENVVLGDFGQVVLLDWGLAKLLREEEAQPAEGVVVRGEETTATLAGAVMGTPAYMAPEQAAGRGDLIDERTDVYGLGAILFEILTGEAPHTGPRTDDLIEQIIHAEARRARDVAPGVPAALDAVCRTALRNEPRERYESASSLADDIERWLADEPVSVYREAIGARLARWARRHRNWVYATLAVVAAVIVVSTVASIRLQSLAERERGARIAAERLREQGLRGAAKFAARTVATEIDLRWTILEREAADATLRGLLEDLRKSAHPTENPDRGALQAWIDTRYADHFATTKATSWFVTDAQGIQIARHPFSAKTLGSRYAFRDYFHGQGFDLAPDAVDVEPIRAVHRSIVFESQANGNLMTAFSVPVRSGEAVIGVLAMTVELGRFGELHLRFSEDQMAVLIDTGKDWQGRQGLILHHPVLAKLRLSDPERRLSARYLDARRTESLIALRSERLRQESELEARDAQAGWTEQSAALIPGSFDARYRDPVVNEATEGEWLAAFEPVIVKGRPDAIRDTGWVVVVQERYSETR